MKSSTPFIPDIHIDSVQCSTLELVEGCCHKIDPGNSIYLYILLRGNAWIEVDGYEPAKLSPGCIVSVGKPIEHSLFVTNDISRKLKQTKPLYIGVDELGWADLTVDESVQDTPSFFVVSIPATTNLVPDIIPSLYLIPKEARSEFPGLWELVSLLLRGDIRKMDVGSILYASFAEAIAKLFTIWGLTKQFSSEEGIKQAGCYDMRIRKVLSAIHGDIKKDWTLDELSSIANMSKSGLSERFKKVVGDSPLSYLSRLRMQKAGSFLKNSSKSIAEISLLAGYQSESAFNKAFKKQLGITPGKFRDLSRAEGGSKVDLS